jgi:predicted nucleotidyltransferase component of viral defense system
MAQVLDIFSELTIRPLDSGVKRAYDKRMDKNWTPAQIIEVFQLNLLLRLPAYLNKDLYCLKGGANLRYFYKNIRLSEDVDLDVLGVPEWRLLEKVNKAISSASFQRALEMESIEITNMNTDKQSQTTQRWKFELKVPHLTASINTRLEFSHRAHLDSKSNITAIDTRMNIGTVPDYIVKPYKIDMGPVIQRYLSQPATEQKISALATRKSPKPRDVFDLEHLFTLYPEIKVSKRLSEEEINQAMEVAISLSFADYRAAVLPFLLPDDISLYDNPKRWDRMQKFVLDKLDALQFGELTGNKDEEIQL